MFRWPSPYIHCIEILGRYTLAFNINIYRAQQRKKWRKKICRGKNGKWGCTEHITVQSPTPIFGTKRWKIVHSVSLLLGVVTHSKQMHVSSFIRFSCRTATKHDEMRASVLEIWFLFHFSVVAIAWIKYRSWTRRLHWIDTGCRCKCVLCVMCEWQHLSAWKMILQKSIYQQIKLAKKILNNVRFGPVRSWNIKRCCYEEDPQHSRTHTQQTPLRWNR